MEQLQKATLVATYSDGSMDFIDVQFNPTEFTLDKGAQIAEIAIPGLDSPLLQFVRGQNEKLTVDLFFDTTEDGTGAGATSVTTQTDAFYSLVKIEPGGHAPPICTFMWNASFPGADLSPNAALEAATRGRGSSLLERRIRCCGSHSFRRVAPAAKPGKSLLSPLAVLGLNIFSASMCVVQRPRLGD
jgi:hypothetical protein